MADPMKYPITYDVQHHEPPLSAEAVRDRQRGGCTDVLLISMVTHADGSYSQVVLGKAANGEDLTPAQLYKAWVLFAHEIKNDDFLPSAKREIAAHAAREAFDLMAATTGQPGNGELKKRIHADLDAILKIVEESLPGLWPGSGVTSTRELAQLFYHAGLRPSGVRVEPEVRS